MSTKTITGISALIKAKLEAIVDGDSNRVIPEVYEYPHGEKGHFPSAEILPIGAISTERIELTGASGARLKRTIMFEIRIFQDNAETASETANERVKNAIDYILSSFDTDPNLSDEVSYVIAEETQIDYNVRPPNAIATITVRCVIIVP